MGGTGRTVGTVGGAGIGTAVAGPVGTVIGGALGGIVGGLFDSDNSAPAPAPVQYGGNRLTNQMGAQQYASGLQQQSAQNARESTLYGQANQNFDTANAAQSRGISGIQGSQTDLNNQLAALGGTTQNAGILRQMGTAPMGPSYAAAQLQAGQNNANLQSLAMAHSGRTIGGGAAQMQQAQFQNAIGNQQVNQAAAAARLQEQQNFNNFQLGALGASTGALGQAGNQANAIRSGNEGLQAQNANLQLQQEGVNNQTSQLYNALGGQQLGFGMQANTLGQQAQQFGATQAQNTLTGQMNADIGHGSQVVNTNIANQNNANAHDAANANAASAALGAGVQMFGGGNATSGYPGTPNPNNPSQIVGPNSPQTVSDARQKTNLIPLEPGLVKFAPGTDQSKFQFGGPAGPAPLPPPSYTQAIGELNQAYAPSQMQAANVLARRDDGRRPMLAPQLSMPLQNYLMGGDPNPQAPPMQPAPVDSSFIHTGAAGGDWRNAPVQQPPGTAPAPTTYDDRGNGFALSDVHSKTRIRDLETQLAALRPPDTASPDAAYRREGGSPVAPPAVDFTAAPGYSYEYKDPTMPGAAPGRHVGPMAQDLERTAGAASVIDTPQGKMVDIPRLTMAHSAAISEQQRKVMALEQQLAALRPPDASSVARSPYPTTQSPY